MFKNNSPPTKLLRSTCKQGSKDKRKRALSHISTNNKNFAFFVAIFHEKEIKEGAPGMKSLLLYF